MLDWLFIILGTVLIAIPFSKPFFNIIIKKFNNIIFLIKYKKTTKFLFFILGIISIFFGLYIESIR